MCDARMSTTPMTIIATSIMIKTKDRSFDIATVDTPSILLAEIYSAALHNMQHEKPPDVNSSGKSCEPIAFCLSCGLDESTRSAEVTANQKAPDVLYPGL